MFSNVYPDTKFLKISTIYSSLAGIFPEEYMFEKNEQYRKIYEFYSKMMLTFFMSFPLFIYIQFFCIINEDVIKYEELGRNICVSLIYTMTIIRQFVMRLHPSYKNVIQYIIKTEKYIFSTKDSEVNSMYFNFYPYVFKLFRMFH